jgi:hypothetical protein
MSTLMSTFLAALGLGIAMYNLAKLDTIYKENTPLILYYMYMYMYLYISIQ